MYCTWCRHEYDRKLFDTPDMCVYCRDRLDNAVMDARRDRLDDERRDDNDVSSDVED